MLRSLVRFQLAPLAEFPLLDRRWKPPGVRSGRYRNKRCVPAEPEPPQNEKHDSACDYYNSQDRQDDFLPRTCVAKLDKTGSPTVGRRSYKPGWSWRFVRMPRELDTCSESGN
jgi:hypothetical protein